MEDSWLTQKETAKMLQVSTRWLLRHRHMGTGPPHVRLGRFIRYKKSDVDVWMRQNQAWEGVRDE